MFIIFKICFLLILFLVSNLHAQNNGDYRSRGTGTWWGTAANWEVFDSGTETWSTATTPPTSNIAVEIQSGHTIINANINRTVTGNTITVHGVLHADQGTLTIGSTTTVHVYGTLIQTANLTVNGSIFIKDNGVYQYNRANTNGIPNMTWEDGSTCEITGSLGSSTVDLPGLNQSFYNFTVNANFGANHRAGGQLQNIRGNFKILNTGSSSREFQLAITQNYTLNIGGSLIIEGGILNIGTGTSGTRNVNIAGDYIQLGGTFRRSNGSATVNFTGATSEFNKTGGTLTTTNINFNVKENAKLSLKSNFDIGNRPLVVEDNSTLDCGTNLLTGISGSFTLNSGATLITAHAEGISSSGATGSIRVTDTRTYNSEANYTYNGTVEQVTGNGLPATVNNLKIDNSNANGISLTNGVTVNGILSLTNGELNLNSKMLTMANNSHIIRSGGSLSAAPTFEASVNVTYNQHSSSITTGVELPSSASVLNNLTINTSNGVTLNDPRTVNGTLFLANGRLNTGACNSTTTSSTLLTLANNATVSGASASSYVNGVMRKIGDDAFIFPVGDANTYAPLGISAPSNASDEFGACYTAGNPRVVFGQSYASGIDHVSACEYWHLNRTNGTSGVEVTMTWDTPRSCGVDNPIELRVARWDGTTWVDHGNASFSGSNAAGSLTSGTISSFSPFTLASSTPNNPLPVELTAFNARCTGSQVELTWTTASEYNASHFTVQMSRDGVNWNDLGVLEAAGTTSLTSNYHLDVPNAGVLSYFRLIQEDLDGTKAIFGPISVNCELNNNLMTVFPNPASEQITISFQSSSFIENARIQLTEMSGRVIMEHQMDLPAGSTMLNLDVQHLQSGAYFVRMHGEQDRFEVVRVVKL